LGVFIDKEELIPLVRTFSNEYVEQPEAMPVEDDTAFGERDVSVRHHMQEVT
jgi:hypothetical protein